jgi:hypothetical protein
MNALTNMPYSLYANTGKALGIILHQLTTIGVPVYIVENVMWTTKEELTYNNKPFAKILWNENDIPIFTFSDQQETYQKLPQLDVYTIHTSNEEGELVKLVGHYTVVPQDKLRTLEFEAGMYGVNFTITKQNVPKNGTSSLEEKMSRLKTAIGTKG